MAAAHSRSIVRRRKKGRIGRTTGTPPTVRSYGGYILSYTKGTISNLDERNPLSAPVREGYDFAGWATSANGEVQYAADELGNVADGTTVYAVWTVAQPEPETPEETTEETSQEV